MRQLIFGTFLFVLLPVLSLQAGEIGSYEVCSKAVREADMAGEEITQAQVAALVAATNKKCLSYAETSEWLNEVLFAAIQSSSVDFIEAFSKAGPEIRNNITHELENPVNDGIDLQETYQALAATGEDNADKQALLTALRSAGKKMGMDLQ